MNIEIQKSEFVKIEGLTEAAVMSSDEKLKVIIRYAETAASYLPESSWDDDLPMHPILQVREACLTELVRRTGDEDCLNPDIETVLEAFESVA